MNESGDRDSVSKWGKVVRALIERIDPNSRKSYEHEGYVNVVALEGIEELECAKGRFSKSVGASAARNDPPPPLSHWTSFSHLH